MKVPPKRKGNAKGVAGSRAGSPSLNESPSEKEGKYQVHTGCTTKTSGLNESPSEKEGKLQERPMRHGSDSAPQ